MGKSGIHNKLLLSVFIINLIDKIGIRMTSFTERKLIDKNTKPTSMRILIYDILDQSESALSLSEIEQMFDKVERTTIYRTLKTFEEKGIVHSIQENNTTRYTLCHDGCTEHTHKDWHLHFYCKICKQTTCEDQITFNERNNIDFRIDEVKLFAKGICKRCLSEVLQ